MKKLTKALLMLAVAVTVIFASASIASAATIQATQVGCEKDSITISIPNTGSGVSYYDIYNISTGEYVVKGLPAYETSYTFYDLEPGVTAYLRIEGYQTGKTYYTDYASIYVNTTPPKVSKSGFGISSIGSDYVYLEGTRPSYDYKVEFEVRKVSSGSKIGSSKGSAYADKIGIKQNVAYKYRTRLYYTNSTNKETYYGPWSSYRYFMNSSASATKYYSSNTSKIKIKGVSKVSKYKIYVSNSRDGKGTLVKTVKPSVGKTVTYSIKTSKTYIKVVPVISGDHTSDTWKILY